MTVEHVDVRAGYDLWSRTYDGEANPLVALDRRVTLDWLEPCAGERLLDAACGTGGHLGPLLRAGTRPVGLDLSRGMLRVARAGFSEVPLVEAEKTLTPRPAQPVYERIDLLMDADGSIKFLSFYHRTTSRRRCGGKEESPGGSRRGRPSGRALR